MSWEVILTWDVVLSWGFPRLVHTVFILHVVAQGAQTPAIRQRVYSVIMGATISGQETTS